MLTVNSNIMSLKAQNNLNASQSNLNKAMERLSSGLRINSAADDAAGLAISDRMTADIRGMTQAKRNANDGVSMIQTAEGGLKQVTDVLMRMRDLSIQAASDTNAASDRQAMQDEYNELSSEITRIAGETRFNGNALLDGSVTTDYTLQIGSGTTTGVDTMTVSFSAVDFSADSFTSATTGGAYGADVNLSTQSLTGAAGARTAVDAIDSALRGLDKFRGELGAKENRLDSTMANLDNMIENQSAARSRIVDTDFAAEAAALSKGQVLTQAGTSMLAQANQSSQSVLSLLR